MKAKEIEIGMVVALHSDPTVGMNLMKFYARPGAPAEWLADLIWLDTELKPHMLVEVPIEAIRPVDPPAAA